MGGILDGVRVLDFGRYVAGPFCGALLADLGAEVIRLERPRGGDDRYLMPVVEGAEGAQYLQCNRGKLSLTLEMGSPQATAVIRRIVPQADVVIANFSPGGLRHMGLDYETLKSLREDIILTTASAFGTNNALEEQIGFDGVGQAVSGAIYLTGEPGQPYRSATAYVDYSTALSCAFGTVAALLHRQRTGEGMHVQTSLACSALNITNAMLIEQATGSMAREPSGNRSPIAGPSDIFKAKDGWFIMQVIGQPMFKRWTELVGRPELLADPLFASDQLRGRNGEALSVIAATWAAERTRGECLAALAERNIAASAVLSPAEVVSGEMGLADAFLRPVTFPAVGAYPIAVPPAQMSGNPIDEFRRPPELGEHTDAVLTRLGFDLEEIRALRQDKVI
jgi:crotonobetainyl-CoA:carnitine CoA-transferase CaiB-like acyl-CoA transferase